MSRSCSWRTILTYLSSCAFTSSYRTYQTYISVTLLTSSFLIADLVPSALIQYHKRTESYITLPLYGIIIDIRSSIPNAAVNTSYNRSSSIVTGGLWWAYPLKQSSKSPKLKPETNFKMSSPLHKCIEDFLATVLNSSS